MRLNSRPFGRLVYKHEHTADVLGGVSIAPIRRGDGEGRRTPARIGRSLGAPLFCSPDQVHALVREASDAAR